MNEACEAISQQIGSKQKLHKILNSAIIAVENDKKAWLRIFGQDEVT